MKFCSKCGAQLADDAAFCPKCGTPCPTSPAQPEPTFSAPAPLDVPPEDLLSSESLPPLEGDIPAMPAEEAVPATGKKSFLDAIKAWSKKKKIIAGSVAALLVVAAVVSFALLYKSEFEQVSDECVQIAGMITGAVIVMIWGNVSGGPGGVFDLYEIVPGFLGNLVVAWAVSRTSLPSEEISEEFDAAVTASRA